MARSFRRLPPELRPGLRVRSGPLGRLTGRWDHPVTVVAGGPGHGKTTLLAAAVAAASSESPGDDVWLGLDPADADGDRLARAVADALAHHERRPETMLVAGDVTPRPRDVADAVWQQAPRPVCLVLDDIHRLPPGSTGERWLVDLAAALPGNGHLLLATATEPPAGLRVDLRIDLDPPHPPDDDQATVAGVTADDDVTAAGVTAGDEVSAAGVTAGDEVSAAGVTAGDEVSAAGVTDDDQATVAGDEVTVAGVTADGGEVTVAGGEVTVAGGEVSGGEVAGAGGEVAGAGGEVAGGGAMADDRVVGVLAELGGGDVELLVAALGTPDDDGTVVGVDPERLRAIAGVAWDAEGWFVLHESVAAGLTPPPDRDAVRVRAVDHLVARTHYDDAFLLAADGSRWDLVPGVLRAACLVAETLPANQLGRWLAASPVEVRATPAGQLAAGLHLVYTDPFEAIEPLHQAAEGYRIAGDPVAELVAVGHIGRLAWWWQDAGLLQEQTRRVFELEQEGHPRAGALAAFAWALVADMGGDDQAVLEHLGRIPPGVLDPGWELLARWYEGLVRLYLGQPAATRIIVDSLTTADPSMSYVVETLELMVLWATGHVDAVMERTPAVVAAARAYGVTYSLALGLTTAGLAYSHTGDPAAARLCLSDALDAAPPPPEGVADDPERLSAQTALATASLRLAEDDEPGAVAILAQAVADHGVDRGTERRWWRQALGLSYVLSPEARAVWDERELRGHLATARTLAASVVALREAGDPVALRGRDVPHVGVARSVLHHRLAAELAVGLAGRGEAEGRHLLDALGAPGRAAVRRIAADPRAGWGPAMVQAAQALLAAVPAPPPEPVHLAVLGPLTLRRGDGDPAPVPLVHQGARDLLAFLVAHRRTTRAAARAAVGRDLAEAVGHLLEVLEPTRRRGEPGYLLRLEGDTVELVSGDHLHLDVDDFDAHVAAAARAESDGAPGVALDHHRAVAAIYRGDLHADAPAPASTPPPGSHYVDDHDDDGPAWYRRERDRYRARFVASAERAAELLAARGARGDADASATLARRARSAVPPS